MELQGKLLRILQEGEFTPVGKTQAEKSDVRFVAATNQNLEKRVEEGIFRKDLFYRLQFAQLTLPPLKTRKDDIPLLADFFIYNSMHSDVRISDNALEALLHYDWPGNVRELKGVLEAAANLAEKGMIEKEMLRIPQAESTRPAAILNEDSYEANLAPMAEIEKKHILHVYKAVDNNKSQAAKILGIGLQTLYRKLKEYNVP